MIKSKRRKREKKKNRKGKRERKKVLERERKGGNRRSGHEKSGSGRAFFMKSSHNLRRTFLTLKVKFLNLDSRISFRSVRYSKS